MRSSVRFCCACANSSVTPDKREEERDGKAADDVVQRHAADVDADDPREREREDADVQLRETTDEDGDDERGERDVSEVHSSAGISS